MVRKSLGGLQKAEWPSGKINLVYDDVTEAALKLPLRHELWSEVRHIGKELSEYPSSGD